MKSYVKVAALAAMLSGCVVSTGDNPAPVARAATLPMAWSHIEDGKDWTAAGIQAVNLYGQALLYTTPTDIEEWCPGYADASKADRTAFWVALISALARHESTWRPDAIGGGGKWFGLTQISPATAQGYDCRATNGTALLNGEANISCAIRIAAVQVSRDDAIVTDGDGWRGMARDWAPFRSASKRDAMKSFTSRQSYCQQS